jgi:methyl-accepting chemotaxis protein
MESRVNNLSVKGKLSILVGIALISLVIIAITSLMSLKGALLHEKEAKVQHLIESAYSSINHYYDEYKSGKISEIEAKAQAKANIESLRYNNNNDYFFILDKDTKMVMHPIKPSLIGKDLSSVKDPNGKYLFVEMVKSTLNGGGFVEYVWEYPATKTLENKISYVKLFEEWGWIVGTGVYIHDVNESFMQEGLKVIVIISIFLIALITVAFIVVKNIQSSVDLFKDGLDKFFAFLNRESSSCENIKLDTKDEFGKMASIVNDNINKTKANIDIDNHLIDDVKKIVEEIQKGYLTVKVNVDSNNPSLNELKNLINKMVDTLRENVGRDINLILDTLNNFSRYDYRKNIDNPTGKISQTVNNLGDTITEMLKENKKNGLILEVDSNTLSTNVNRLNTSANQQAAAIEQTASSLEEITSNIKQTSNQAQEMLQIGDETKKSTQIGEKLAKQTATAMEEINTSTQSIKEAIEAIDQIAFQTNILSLNAAVEAATAGEAGRGFAVVAGEVRNLANRSADVANDIKDIVTNSTAKAEEGMNISKQMIDGFDGLSKNITHTIRLVEDVANATKEQMIGISQINDAITELDHTIQDNAIVANQTNDIAIQASSIAKIVVDKTNENEFRGKENITLESVKKSNNLNTEMQPNQKVEKKSTKPVENKIDHNDSSWDTF